MPLKDPSRQGRREGEQTRSGKQRDCSPKTQGHRLEPHVDVVFARGNNNSAQSAVRAVECCGCAIDVCLPRRLVDLTEHK